ncbi:hypothetical protein HN51_010360 [Arachis hypogaea]|uniref:SCP domain-containing protein n=1 Tax=Arachis hypogaea TaxID=3818 RepID=A0A445E3J5_ARAHY|nr:pathogenesis-related protein 1-like [Arachis hypogaea]QHO55444.1 Pathogenesis-related protein [Arachis hypogaea]RYR69935.1 hypothetical protein Ahy_A03g016470 [Arachis hypogaea]
MRKLPILAVLTSFVSILPLCLLAQNSPQDYLRVHNDERTRVGVKPLVWDSVLESHANNFLSKHIEDCMRVRYIDPSPFTRNMLTSGSTKTLTGEDAVAWWVAQKQNYDYESNSCIDGTLRCLTYTQVVSKASIYLGCARVECNNNGGTIVMCYYDPPGNHGHPY